MATYSATFRRMSRGRYRKIMLFYPNKEIKVVSQNNIREDGGDYFKVVITDQKQDGQWSKYDVTIFYPDGCGLWEAVPDFETSRITKGIYWADFQKELEEMIGMEIDLNNLKQTIREHFGHTARLLDGVEEAEAKFNKKKEE